MPQTAPSPSPVVPPRKAAMAEQAKPDRIPVIRQNVLKALGLPKNLHSVRVVEVWGNNFRVNVFCNKKDPSAAFAEQILAHSFFIRVSENGDILKSDPEIIKQYE